MSSKAEMEAKLALQLLTDELFAPLENLKEEYFEFCVPWYQNTEETVVYCIPSDIFGAIMLFIPAYPFYFSMIRVNKQWNKELQEKIYFLVEKLDLLDRLTAEQRLHWKSFYTVAGYLPKNNLDALPKSYHSQTNIISECINSCNSIWAFLVKCFPNVTHIKMRCYHSAEALASLLVFFKEWKLKSLSLYFDMPKDVLQKFSALQPTVQVNFFGACCVSEFFRTFVTFDKLLFRKYMFEEFIPPECIVCFKVDAFVYAMQHNDAALFNELCEVGTPSLQAFCTASQTPDLYYLNRMLSLPNLDYLEPWKKCYVTSNSYLAPGKTILQLVVEHNHKNSITVLELLLQLGFEQLPQFVNLLQVAVKANNMHVIDFLIDLNNRTATKYPETNLFHNIFVDAFSPQMIEYLFSKGLKPTTAEVKNILIGHSECIPVFLTKEWLPTLLEERDASNLTIFDHLLQKYSTTKHIAALQSIINFVGIETFRNDIVKTLKNPFFNPRSLFYDLLNYTSNMNVVDYIKFLLSYFNWNEVSEYGKTPICYISEKTLGNIVQKVCPPTDYCFILANDDHMQQTVLMHLVSSCKLKAHNKISLLQQYTAAMRHTDTKQNNIFHYLFFYSGDQEKIVEWVCNEKPEFMNLLWQQNSFHETPLLFLWQKQPSLTFSHLELLKSKLKEEEFMKIEWTTNQTVLTVIAKWVTSHCDQIEKICPRKYWNTLDLNGNSILHSAIQFENINLFDALLQNKSKEKPKLNKKLQNSHGHTPLYLACYYGNITFYKQLKDKSKIKFDPLLVAYEQEKYEFVITCLHKEKGIDCKHAGLLCGIVFNLMHQKKDISRIINEYMSKLQNSAELLNELTKERTPPVFPNPVSTVTTNQIRKSITDEQVVNPVLNTWQLNVNMKQISIIYKAMLTNNFVLLNWFLNSFRTTSHFITYVRVSRFISDCMDVHSTAVRSDQKKWIPCFHLLVELLGRDVINKSIDIKGNTLLHKACEKELEPLIALLIQHGANCDVKNYEQKRCLDVVKHNYLLIIIQQAQGGNLTSPALIDTNLTSRRTTKRFRETANLPEAKKQKQ